MGLTAKLKITEFLPVHPSLDAGGLNKCGHIGLSVKWKDVKCPGLREWDGFAPLKQNHRIVGWKRLLRSSSPTIIYMFNFYFLSC